jgi:hypothetical protein
MGSFESAMLWFLQKTCLIAKSGTNFTTTYVMTEEKNYTGLIPSNTEGKAITAEAVTTMNNVQEAQALYTVAHDRLLYVHKWGKLVGGMSADFQLTDENGKEVDRFAQQGDHFRIDIPGPGSSAGEGYDWARVEAIQEVHEGDVDSIAIRVRPAANPQNTNNNVAHFYSDESTSTFVITREGTKVTASVYDRNIEANDETKSLIDKARNTMVGLGAKHGISKIQWQALAEAFVKTG